MTKTREVLIPAPDPDNWTLIEKTGISFQVLWEDPETGATISLLDAPEGSGVPTKHAHASNQFMYCIEGEYEYTESELTLTKGSFYMNPKGNPHGPTRANKRSSGKVIFSFSRSVPSDLPTRSSSPTRSRMSSTTWKAVPIFIPKRASASRCSSGAPLKYAPQRKAAAYSAAVLSSMMRK